MIKYDLTKLAQRRKGTKMQLPQLHGSVGAEQSYLKAVRVMLRTMAATVREELIPVVERELIARRETERITQDVDNSFFERLAALGNALAATATDTISRILRLESARHTKTFMQQAKSTLGVDLAALVREEDLEDYLETAITRNAGLIKGLSQATVQRVQVTVTNAVLNGKTMLELKKLLTEDFNFSDKRAKVIARDQIAKANSDLNRIRHTQAGITTYTWRTSRDERVRPRHKTLDGKVYDYGKPTGAEDGLPPGQPIQCRCIAQAIVEF